MKILVSILFLQLTLFGHTQNPERKIIVQEGKYYYTTIHDEFQVGTLHSGDMNAPLKEALHYALPAGRNYSEPVVPFAWDIRGKHFYAVNFLMHPLNDRNEAIKRIPFTALKQWDTTMTAMNLIMQSVELNTYVLNDPYLFAKSRSKYLDKFYYDAIAVSDSSYYMAVANAGELTLWQNNGKAWKRSEVINFPVNGYFSLCTYKQKTYLVLSSGAVHEITLKGISSKPVVVLPKALNSVLLVENRDENTLMFLSSADLNQEQSLKEILKRNGISIFKK